nr:DUF6414 family protein [Mediterraneibacter massiliensis]
MANKICKIVYFDEASVTDDVQIVAGGSLETTIELLKSSEANEKQEVGATAKGGIGGIFKALVGWEASANGEISAEKDSLSYMVMVSPYLSMLKTGSSVPAGEFNIAIDKLENALKNAKGYYEFVGIKGKSKVS